MKVIIVFTLKIYKLFVSPGLEVLFGKACRFTPTCSEYAIEVINEKGIYKGLRLSLIRFIKCNPLKRLDYSTT